MSSTAASTKRPYNYNQDGPAVRKTRAWLSGITWDGWAPSEALRIKFCDDLGIPQAEISPARFGKWMGAAGAVSGRNGTGRFWSKVEREQAPSTKAHDPRIRAVRG